MLRNGETGDWIGTFQGHKGAVWSCCLDKHALRAASASADFSAKLWDALTGDELHSFEHKHIVRAVPFSEVPAYKYRVHRQSFLSWPYELVGPDAPPREIEKSPGSVRTVAWLHSDQTILGSCTDMGGVRFYAFEMLQFLVVGMRTGTIVRTLETKSSVTSAEVSQDGRYITTADGSTVKFWDAISPVHCVRFSPGGESYASGSEDGTIRIWQTGPQNNTNQETSGTNGPIQNVKDAADEVARQIEIVHIAEEDKNVSEKAQAG
ncbi:UNVERIFIED_CONTAM: Serine-threonine kinase receptor-associated protein [Sesamum angustifolium]|uniref:Serine-threonine kinase receptor-associated protein n=1 Tax=Sesamum angustifolium TaxID=2727405 RepID=A0AAW2LL57_9LAMI